MKIRGKSGLATLLNWSNVLAGISSPHLPEWGSGGTSYLHFFEHCGEEIVMLLFLFEDLLEHEARADVSFLISQLNDILVHLDSFHFCLDVEF